MRARAEVTYTVDDPGEWEESYDDSDPTEEFIKYVHRKVKNIGGGVSSEFIRVVKVDEGSPLGTIAGAPWHGLPVDQRPPLPDFPPLPEPGSAPGEADDEHDPVDHPKHYMSHPSGIECITVTEHMNFCLGNAVKYIWRAGEKGNTVEDLEKAVWYLQREIARIRDSETDE